ncbi:MAG: glycosyl transferase family 2 [Acidimicrobiaceae bacterium]|jgi:glycosyltransferase involved in cell wall biosynthesis|nr:glycosyl transferase family 2 [Acidimicrobiaceae bacterium]|tara:strand:- start:19129 stop:20127 length:999 start_codon:yes stop_codon:yes gene_type:complete
MPESSYPEVSVILPVLNAEKTLEETVDSILAQTYKNIKEINLALGPSSDQTTSVALRCQAKDQRIRIIKNPSGSTATSLNMAAALASGKFLARVDAHCKLPKDYISIAVAKILETGATNVGGIQQAVGKTEFQRSVATAMTSRFGIGNSKFHYGGDEGPTDTVFLGFYDAQKFDELGGFDETLIRNQDYELNIRIRKSNGMVWFTPELKVSYYPRSSLKELSKQYFQYGKWKRKVVFKNPKYVKLRQLVPPLSVLILVSGTFAGILVSPLFFLPHLIYFFSIAFIAKLQPGLNSKRRIYLLAIFPIMHMSWGVGFLIGRTTMKKLSGSTTIF